MTGGGLMQIGEVADRTGLSLRTIRYYEEAGLVRPATRSQGGFRLYTDEAVERLLLIKRMKPLDFTIEQMRDLLDVLDRLGTGRTRSPAARRVLHEKLTAIHDRVTIRCEALQAQLTSARAFADDLRRHLDRPA